MWLNLVERSLWEREVASSNLATQTKFVFVVNFVVNMESWPSPAYGTGLEHQRGVKASVGSNPTLSAKLMYDAGLVYRLGLSLPS